MAIDTVELAYFLNRILELPAGTAERFAKFLKIGDLLSKSKGGVVKGGKGNRGGALATSADAAALILGIFGARSAESAADFVRRVGSFGYVGTIIRPDHGDYVTFLPPDVEDPNSRTLMKQNFITALANIIQSIEQGLGYIGANPQNVVPADETEQIARAAGRGTASMVLPFGAARAVMGAAPAAEATGVLPALGSGTLTSNVAAGAAGGATGQYAANRAPEPLKPIADLAGNILGGGLGGLSVSAVKKVLDSGGTVADAIAPFGLGKSETVGTGSEGTPVTATPAQQRVAGQRLLAASSQPQTLPAKLDEAVTEPQLVPGSTPTTFQATGDQGLGQLERATATENPAPFLARQSNQNAARVNQLDTMAPAGSNAGSVGDYLANRLNELDAAHTANIQQAQDRASTTLANIGGNLPANEYGAAIRNELVNAKTAAKTNESALWNAIDPEGNLAINVSPVKQAADNILASVSPSAKPIQGEEAAILNVARGYNNVQPFSDLTALRGRLLDEIRAERPNGQTPALRRMQMLRQSIDDTIANGADTAAQQQRQAVSLGQLAPEETIGARLQAQAQQWQTGRNGGTPPVQPTAAAPTVPNFDVDAAARYRAAANATRERAQTFGSGPVGQVLRPGPNGLPFAVNDSQAAGKFFNSGGHASEDLDSFMNAVGDRPTAVAALQDYAASDLRSSAMRPDGTLNPTKFQSWLDDHYDTLRRFPELVGRFSDAASAQTSVEAATAAKKEALRDYQQGAAKYFLGADPHVAVDRALRSTNPQETFSQLAKLTEANPDAREGLQRAVAEHMTERLSSNTLAGDTGTKMLKSDAFQKFVTKNEAALSQVFSPEQVKSLKAIAADLQRANQSVAGSKLPGGSNTAQDTVGHGKFFGKVVKSAFSHINPELMGILLGEEHGGLVGASVALGLRVISAMRGAGVEKINDLVTEAMLHPEIARTLLSKVPPTKAAQEAWQTKLVKQLVKLGSTGVLDAAQRPIIPLQMAPQPLTPLNPPPVVGSNLLQR